MTKQDTYVRTFFLIAYINWQQFCTFCYNYCVLFVAELNILKRKIHDLYSQISVCFCLFKLILLIPPIPFDLIIHFCSYNNNIFLSHMWIIMCVKCVCICICVTTLNFIIYLNRVLYYNHCY